MRLLARRFCSYRGLQMLGLTLLAGLGAGCGSDDKLENKNPGINNRNVVVAFGDSITQGSQCSCVPYPARLSPLIGKTVVNTGIGGSMARENMGRTQQVIDRNHPAFMLILYGVNDLIHGGAISTTLDSLSQMVIVCRQNNVVPVLATYPIPFGSHRGFTDATRGLNSGIRELARSLGVACVDLEQEFAQEPDPSVPETPEPLVLVTNTAFMESDGLHPNDMGTQVMALAFADLF